MLLLLSCAAEPQGASPPLSSVYVKAEKKVGRAQTTSEFPCLLAVYI